MAPRQNGADRSLKRDENDDHSFFYLVFQNGALRNPTRLEMNSWSSLHESLLMNDILFHTIKAAPKGVAPFSHATEVNGFVFVTGQMPTWPDDPNRAIPEGIEAQTRRVMDNLIIVLKGVGLTLSDVVQVRVYITEFERDYAAMNDVYASYFPADRLPARTCVGVTGLAVGALVEIDMVARRPDVG